MSVFAAYPNRALNHSLLVQGFCVLCALLLVFRIYLGSNARVAEELMSTRVKLMDAEDHLVMLETKLLELQSGQPHKQERDYDVLASMNKKLASAEKQVRLLESRLGEKRRWEAVGGNQTSSDMFHFSIPLQAPINIAHCIVGHPRSFDHPAAWNSLLMNGVEAAALGSIGEHARDVFFFLIGGERFPDMQECESHPVAEDDRPRPVAEGDWNKWTERLRAVTEYFAPVMVEFIPLSNCSNPRLLSKVRCCQHEPERKQSFRQRWWYWGRSGRSSRRSRPHTRRLTSSSSSSVAPLGAMQYFWISECFDHVRQYEGKLNFKYDWVTRLRPDLILLEPLPAFRSLPRSRILFTYKGTDAKLHPGTCSSTQLWDVIFLIPCALLSKLDDTLHIYMDGHDCEDASMTTTPESALSRLLVSSKLPFQIRQFFVTKFKPTGLLDCFRASDQCPHRNHTLEIGGSNWGNHWMGSVLSFKLYCDALQWMTCNGNPVT